MHVSTATEKLGEILVREGWITPQQRDWATAVQEKTGCRLGAILVAAGLIRRDAVYRVLARTWECDYVDLVSTPLDLSLLDGLDPLDLREEGWLPYRRDGERVVVATSERPTPERQRSIERRLGSPVKLVITTDWDILQSLHTAYRETVVEQATLGLWRRDHVHSARQTLLTGQRVLLGLVLAGLAAGIVLAHRPTITLVSAAASLTLFAAVLFRIVVCAVGMHRKDRVRADVAALDARDLPTYTVLVPVYQEADAVADLIDDLGALDYPREKLEILLLMEANDTATIEAARAARPPSTITFLIVPPGLPQTKAKACNVGLFFARGEFVTIFDAGDQPEPDQLKKAVIAFRRGGDPLVCVRAALNHRDAEENWLTRMVTAERSSWFGHVLPGLERLRLPIPIGGASSHFRTRGLRMLGGWDPFNVTEDADLGIRAAALGRTVSVIDSTTSTQVSPMVDDWLHWRSRRIEGDLQTLLVHLRRPVTLAQTAGVRRAAAFALLVGGPVMTSLLAPPLFATVLVALMLPGLLPEWVLWIGLVDVLAGVGLTIYVGAFRTLRSPGYWLLHSAAAYTALWRLVTRPHHRTDPGPAGPDSRAGRGSPVSP